MHPIDVTLLLAFVLWALVSGLTARRRASRSLEEYFLAGRSLKGTMAGASMAATQFAADTPLLVTGLIATAGVASLWRLWIYAVAFLLLGFVFAGPWRRARVLTDAELSELRYGGKPALALRAAKALYFGTLFNCTVLAFVLLAATRVAEPFLLWDTWLPASLFDAVERAVRAMGVPLTGSDVEVWRLSARNLLSLGAIVVVTLFYSATGGLRSVVRTDVLQLALMLGGTAAYAFVVVREVGGLEALTQVDPGLRRLTPSVDEAGWALLFVFALQWLLQLNADGTGYLAQRTMACESDDEARRAAVVFTVLQVLVRSLLWLPIGVGLLLLFPPSPSLAGEALVAEREMSFVRGMELLPPGARGLMLTAMLAALASTVDTHLNWGASYWTNDLFRRLLCERLLRRRPKDRTLVWVARASNLLILALSLVVMSQLGSIQRAWQVSLLLGAGVGVVLVLRWLWWRISGWAELASLGASLVLAPLLVVFVEGDATRLLLGAAGATAVALVTALALGPEEPAVLDRFYQRARPPGAWGPVAARHGEEPRAPLRRLRRGLAATATASLALFCLLVGAGSWLLRSPPPGFFPFPRLWAFGLLAVGLGLVPLVWRLGELGRPAAGEGHSAPKGGG